MISNQSPLSQIAMENRYLAHLECLTMAQKTLLAKGKLQTVSDLLLIPPSDATRKCRTTPRDMQLIIDLVCKELYEAPQPLSDIVSAIDETFTSGDHQIDKILGGGFRPGIVWEICGEGSAGKTQLAMQLALTVQLTPEQGGLSGSAYYICSREELQTSRLEQILRSNPRLSPDTCSLSNVHTQRARNYGILTRLLTTIGSSQSDENPGAMTPKLLIIDTFSDFFDEAKDSTYQDRFLRAKHLREASVILHQLATRNRLVVVVLCSAQSSQVRIDDHDAQPDELLYADQERWFSRAHSMPGEDAFLGSLGLVWTNQVNVRVMMTRTSRTRQHAEVEPGARGSTSQWDARSGERASKRTKLDTGVGDEPVLFRRLSVVFSSISPSASCDYVILKCGVVGFAAAERPPSTFIYETPPSSQRSASGAHDPLRTHIPTTDASSRPAIPQPSHQPSPLRIGAPGDPSTSTESSQRSTSAAVPGEALSSPPATSPPRPTTTQVVPSSQPEEEDDEMYWRHVKMDDHTFSQMFNEQPTSEDARAAAEDGPQPDDQDVEDGGHLSSDSEHYWNETDSGIVWTDL